MTNETCRVRAYVTSFRQRHPDEVPGDVAFFEALCSCPMCAEGFAQAHEAEEQRHVTWQLQYDRDYNRADGWDAR